MFISKPERTFSLVTTLSIALVFLASCPTLGHAQIKTTVKKNTAPYTASAIMSDINKARNEENLTVLVENKQLTAAAQAKAKHMIENDYFSHWSPDGSTPWDFIDNAGYDYRKAGENLAVRFTNSEKMVRAWLNSPTHRTNIMNADYKETGIGIAYGEIEGQKGWVVVQMFGSK